MPDIEEQLKDRMEALAAAQERQGTAEEHCSMVSEEDCRFILKEIKLKTNLFSWRTLWRRRTASWVDSGSG